MKEILSKHSVNIQIGTIVSVIVFMIGSTLAYSAREEGQNTRIALVEQFKEEGDRFTKEDSQRLADQITLRLDRMDNKLDTLILNIN